MLSKPTQTSEKILFFYLALLFNIFLGWLLTKINTGYLSVSDYGKYSFFIVTIYFSRSLFGFGMFEGSSRILALSKITKEQKEILGASIVWAVILSIPFSILIYLFADIFDLVFNVKIGGLLKEFSFMLAFLFVYSQLLLVLRGTGQINLLALITFLPRVCYIVLLACVIYWSIFTVYKTVLMMFLGLGLTSVLTIIKIKPIFKQFRKTTERIWRELRFYGIHIYVSSVWHEILFHADKFIISYFLDAQSMAYYALGYMLTFPLSHFSYSLATTLFNKFASQERINSRVLNTNLIVVGLSVSLFIVLRKPIIVYLFSELYIPTIELILPLALAFGFSGLSKPFTLFLMAKGHGKAVRNISIVIPIIHVILNILLVPKFGIYGAAWIACIVYSFDFILFFYVYKTVLKSEITTDSAN